MTKQPAPGNNGNLFILRHAKALGLGRRMSDFDRPLSKRGWDDLRRLCRFIRNNEVAPDLILCSTARRARETLAGILPALAQETEIKMMYSLYLADADTIIENLRAIDRPHDSVGSVMVVGHNPSLQNLATQLCGKGDKRKKALLTQKFPTAALATFSVNGKGWAGIAPETCRAGLLFTPKETYWNGREHKTAA